MAVLLAILQDRKLSWRRFAGVLALAVALSVAVWEARPPRISGAGAFPAVSATLEPLRHDFNAEQGRVRLVMLIDPT